MLQFIINILLVFIILSFPYFTLAQPDNLVPNSSFERYNELPNDVAQGPRCISDWIFPNIEGTGEYYHTDCNTRKAGTKKNTFGQQVPHTGKAYAGICITKKFREYLQIELNRSLIKDKKYSITMFISCADKLGLSTVNEFNVLFSSKSFLVPVNENLSAPPAIRFIGEFNNKKEWIELSSTYVAKGMEQFITIGSFPYIENGVAHSEIDGIIKYAHYYIDDISITLIDDRSLIQEDAIQEHISEETSYTDSLVSNFSTDETYIFDNLLFESGKSILLSNDYLELEKLILFLKDKTDFKLLITEHTDNMGTLELNQKLSYDRANALKSYLIKKGLDEEIILTEGKGDSVPLSTNDTEAGRKQNRRVEITIIK